jgi:hypothetical protein
VGAEAGKIDAMSTMDALDIAAGTAETSRALTRWCRWRTKMLVDAGKFDEAESAATGLGRAQAPGPVAPRNSCSGPCLNRMLAEARSAVFPRAPAQTLATIGRPTRRRLNKRRPANSVQLGRAMA